MTFIILPALKSLCGVILKTWQGLKLLHVARILLMEVVLLLVGAFLKSLSQIFLCTKTVAICLTKKIVFTVWSS